MKLNLKKLLTFLPVFVILAAFTSLGTVQADASQYYYFKEPTGKVSYKVGDKVPVTFYAGACRTFTTFVGGMPASTTYLEMPVTFKVFKGSTEIYSKGFTYTRGTTIETTYTPAASGTLKFCIYGRPLGLGANEQVLQETITITVKKNNPAAVKSIKPAITVERTAKKKATITCTNDQGYGMKIYRSEKKKGKFKLIKTIKKPSYTDSKLAASKVYYYKVQLFSKKGKKTYLSKWSKVMKAGKYTGPSVPAVTLKYQGAKGVLVSWKCTSKVDRFYVLRTENKNDNGGSLLADLPKSKFSYYDNAGLEKGKTYYYFVLGIKNPTSDHPTKYFSKQYPITIP